MKLNSPELGEELLMSMFQKESSLHITGRGLIQIGILLLNPIEF
jgi:hypothetical protein